MNPADDGGMRALSIRQPYAELILRGIKTVEYRSRRTAIIGERFYIYAGKARAMKRLKDAETKWLDEPDLPRGVIVGTAIITHCEPEPDFGGFMWHLAKVERLDKPLTPKRRPQPVWFRPF